MAYYQSDEQRQSLPSSGPSAYPSVEANTAHQYQSYQQPSGSYQPYQGQTYVAVAIPEGQYHQNGGYAPYAQPVSFVGGGDPQEGAPRLIGGWSDGICDWFSDFWSCCLSLWCPCIRWGQTLNRAGLWTFASACLIYGMFRLMSMCFNGNALPYYLDIPELAWLSLIGIAGSITLGVMYRARLRRKYSIPGGTMEDCLLHTFCNVCALAQEARHVDRDLGILPITERHYSYQQYGGQYQYQSR